LANGLKGLIYLYRGAFSPFMPPSCRYYPTCSEYGLEAIRVHGPLKGGWLAMKRVGYCHPWGGSGYDPVPGTKETREHEDRGSNFDEDE